MFVFPVELCLRALLRHNILAAMVPIAFLGREDLFKALFTSMSASKGCRLSDVQVVHKKTTMLKYVRKLSIFREPLVVKYLL